MDVDMRLERMLGHVPALVHPHPRSILIVGVGAGVTAGALSIHPEVERIVDLRDRADGAAQRARLFRRREPSRLRRPARRAGLRRCAALPADDARDVRHHHVGSDPPVGARRGDALLARVPAAGKGPPQAGRRRHAVDPALRNRRAIGEERDRHLRAACFPTRRCGIPTCWRKATTWWRSAASRAAPISEAAIQARLDASAARQAVARRGAAELSGATSLAPTPGAAPTSRRGWPTPRSTASAICACSIWRDSPPTWSSAF